MVKPILENTERRKQFIQIAFLVILVIAIGALIYSTITIIPVTSLYFPSYKETINPSIDLV